MKQTLALILLFVVAVNLPELKVLLAGEIDYDPAVAGEVSLYATKWCGYCTKTRAFLKKNQIPYTEYDIEESPEALEQMTALGGFGVPLILVGDTVIKGYQPSALASALNSKK